MSSAWKVPFTESIPTKAVNEDLPNGFASWTTKEYSKGAVSLKAEHIHKDPATYSVTYAGHRPMWCESLASEAIHAYTHRP